MRRINVSAFLCFICCFFMAISGQSQESNRTRSVNLADRSGNLAIPWDFIYSSNDGKLTCKAPNGEVIISCQVMKYQAAGGTYKDALALTDADFINMKRLTNAQMQAAKRVTVGNLKGFQLNGSWSLGNQSQAFIETVLEEKDRMVVFTLIATSSSYFKYYNAYMAAVRTYSRTGAVTAVVPAVITKPIVKLQPYTGVMKAAGLIFPLIPAKSGTYLIRIKNWNSTKVLVGLLNNQRKLVAVNNVKVGKDSSKNRGNVAGFFVDLVANQEYKLFVSSMYKQQIGKTVALDVKPTTRGAGFKVISAKYGNPAGALDVTTKIQDRIKRGYSSIKVKNREMGGDPVNGGKYLTVVMDTPLGRFSKKSPEGTYFSFRDLKDISKMTPAACFMKSEITIESAKYGNQNGTNDVLAKVSSTFKSGKGYLKVKNRDMGGDPADGPKYLSVVVKTPVGRFQKKVTENGALICSDLMDASKMTFLGGTFNANEPIYLVKEEVVKPIINPVVVPIIKPGTGGTPAVVKPITVPATSSVLKAGMIVTIHPELAPTKVLYKDFSGCKISAVNSLKNAKSAQFKVIAGLSDPKAFSFESVDQPGYYIRGWGFSVSVDRKFSSSATFLKAYTWKAVAGLSGKGFSFESSDKAGSYIHADGDSLEVERKRETNAFKTKATFIIKQVK